MPKRSSVCPVVSIHYGRKVRRYNWHSAGVVVGLVITKLRKVYCWVYEWKKLKSRNIWQSYKKRRDCFVHFLRLLAVCWPSAPVHEIIKFLLPTLPNIHRFKKIHSQTQQWIMVMSLWTVFGPPCSKHHVLHLILSDRSDFNYNLRPSVIILC